MTLLSPRTFDVTLLVGPQDVPVPIGNATTLYAQLTMNCLLGGMAL